MTTPGDKGVIDHMELCKVGCVVRGQDWGVVSAKFDFLRLLTELLLSGCGL